MRKTFILSAVLALLAGVCYGQSSPFPCTITIASGQSLSPALIPTNLGPGCTQPSGTAYATPLQIFPPSALDATSYGLLIYSCTDVAGTTCLPGQDSAGNKLLIPLIGGTAPTSYVQLDPGVMAGGRTYKFQVVTSAGAAVPQTSARTFTLMVRPL